MQKEQFLEILKKYQDGDASAEEVEFLRTYYNLFELEPEILNILKEKEKTAIKDRIEDRLMEQIAVLEPTYRRKSYRWIAVAASLLLILSFGGYFLLHKKPSIQTAQNLQNDIAPGGNKLVLTLGNGTKIDLTAAKKGKLAMQGQTVISKLSNGGIIYVAPVGSSNEISYNTVSAPRGGQGALTLSDGTKVWLNSSSSITFPTVFKGDRRLITMTGEIVIKPQLNAKMPFYAMARGQMSKDIGTEFDINAYEDEPVVKTTLLEGSVQITANGKSVVLKPGQQSVVQPSSNNIKVENVDTDEAFAWKNGKFLFSGTSLGNIMRQVSRWYDVDVVYQDEALKVKPFSAISTRFTNVSQVLHNLELTGEIKFKIQGKTITVLNK